MSYIKNQLQQVQPADRQHPDVPVKVKFVSAWGQTNYLTLSPSTYAKVAAIIAEEVQDE